MTDEVCEQENGGPELIPENKRARSLKYSVVDGIFYSSMVGFGETYFIPLLIFIGATNVQVGIYSAAPQIGVALSQFLSILIIDKYRTRKRIIVTGASSQLIFLALMAGCLAAGALRPWSFILMAVAYFFVNGAVIPSWNSLIGDLTTPENRGAYFGRRNGLTQLTSFAAVLIAGGVLQYFTGRGAEAAGFIAIIMMAFLSRIGSVYALSKHYEVPYVKSDSQDFSFYDFIKRSPHSNFAHFVFFVGLMSFAVHVSAPFFAVYMLRDLHFSYMEYTLAQGTFIATQFIAMRRWGPFSDKYGNRIVLRISATLLPIIPLCWLFSRNFYAIVFFQFLSGLAWAGWALASANFIFDAVTPPKRARCAAYLNFFNSLGIGVGSLTGAYLCTKLPSGIVTSVMNVSFISNLNYLFVISVLLRFFVVFLFMPTVREVRQVQSGGAKDMFMMLASIRPLSGVKFNIFTGIDRKPRKNGDAPEDASKND